MPDPLLIRGARGVIRAIGACAPAWRRDDLRREWLAELQAYASHLSAARRLTTVAQLRLFVRCCSALFHVIWSWKHEWSVDMMMQDVRYGLRILRRRPVMSTVAILTLGLGIGATTAMFGAVRGVLLRPLPYPQPGRLVKLHGVDARTETRRLGNLSVPDVMDYQRLVGSLESLGAHNYGGYFTLTGLGDAQRVPRLLVTSGYFRVLGARPAMGRLFSADEDRPTPPDVVVVSHGFWRNRLGSDPGIIGRAVTLSGYRATIVGVLPADFLHPDPAIEAPPEVFALLDPAPEMSGRGGRYVRAVARLRPTSSSEQAESELQAAAAALAEQYPATNRGRSAGVEPLDDAMAGDLRRPLLLLQGATCAVLLIVCVNLANLLLAAGAGRAAELAVRTALGAGRARIVRQLLTEGLVLAAIGGALGIAVAWGATGLLSRAVTLSHVHRARIALDPVVLLFAIAASLGAGLVFGLVPAFRAARAADGFHPHGTARQSDGPSSARLRFGLIAAEVGLTLMLLVPAILLVKSFWRLTSVDPGFDVRGVLSFQVAVPLTRYPEGTQVNFFESLYLRLRALPGVESVGAVNILPLSGSYSCDGFQIAGRLVPEGQTPCAEARSASPDYFEAMGIRLVRGRLITERDTETSPRIVLINEAMAREFFPDEDPVGRRIIYSSRGQNDAREIVGVVADVRHFGVQRDAPPEFYTPQRQPPSYHGMTIVLRGSGDPSAHVPAVRGVVRALDPDAPLYNVRTMDGMLGRSIAEERVRTALLTLFAALALLLAILGTYGVLSIAVAYRTREMGIRLALGADASNVVRLVVGQGLQPIALGIGLGLGGSVLISRSLGGLLFHVSAADPLAFTVAPLLMAAAAVVAAWLPARRACRVDPATALRQ